MNFRLLELCVLTLCLFLTSCSKADLYVRSEYFSRDQLASCIIDTPDERKTNPEFGQRLIINWSMTENTFKTGPKELVLRVKLKNGEEKKSTLPLAGRQGRTFYPIFGNDYFKKGGLQSYRVELKSGSEVLAKSQHKLWVENVKTKQK
jgi:hypothetical protein